MNLRRLTYILLVAIIIPGLLSCRSTRPIVSTAGSEPNAQVYINDFKDLAVNEMKRTGIPASITLAQGMIESDFGHSRLAREANNHFGIKCHDDWKGPTIRHNDDRRNECFRKYSRPEDSYYDHSDFLRSVSRYRFLFEIEPTDYKAWARGLKKAGYATNPQYANMLIRKIEENNLYNFDRGYTVAKLPQQQPALVNVIVAQHDSVNNRNAVPEINDNFKVTARVNRVMENNRIQYIIVKDGETREKIENEFQLLKWELSRYNELASDFSPVAGQLLYLQPKREKAEPGKEHHTVAEGDTMYSISQKYGIKLKSLYEMNRMAEGEELTAGQKIWLRNLKPVN
ncbi:MAG: glucosaminidase domain-containing protein [Bacteroidales bacterium]|nr:glucosaminidase domain-containing protein [Bacteroidales bacterium]